MAPLPLILTALIGALAACVNTLAGGGSFLVIAALVEGLGVNARIANGTLRVGVLVQTSTAVLGFWRRGVSSFSTTARLAPTTALGALGGAVLATRLSAAFLRPLFGGLLWAWAGLLLLRPRSFSAPSESAPARQAGPLAAAIALLIGLYGGLVQAGVGFPLMALLVPYLRVDPVRANSVKVSLVLCYTIATVPIFSAAHGIDWKLAAALAAGQLLGALAGVHLQIWRGAALVRWALALTLLGGGAAMLLR